MLTYQGFVAQIEYEPETDSIVGEVVNSEDVLMFKGKDLDQLKKQFANVVDDYISMSKVENFPVITPFVGRFTVCLAPDDQRKLFEAAEQESIGVQQWLQQQIQRVLETAK